jgi:phospholipase C
MRSILAAFTTLFASIIFAQPSPPASRPIEHVIVILKENHTFDAYFGQFPGADGAHKVKIKGKTKTPPKSPDRPNNDINHGFESAHKAYHNGAMDQFDQVQGAIVKATGFPLAFAQFRETTLPAYWTYAKEFALFDRYFTALMGPSAPNHFYLVAASSGGAIANPRGDKVGGEYVPSCSAPTATIEVLTPTGTKGTQPACLDIPTLPNLLAAKGITWALSRSSVRGLIT